jgi:hypothetical protein
MQGKPARDMCYAISPNQKDRIANAKTCYTLVTDEREVVI